MHATRTVTEAEYQFFRGAMAIWRGWQDMPRAERLALTSKHYSFEWGFGQLEEWAPEIQQEQQEALAAKVNVSEEAARDPS